MAKSDSPSSLTLDFRNVGMSNYHPGLYLDVDTSFTYAVTRLSDSEFDVRRLQQRLELITAVLDTNLAFQRRRA